MTYTTEELRAMLAGITPGPWEHRGETVQGNPYWYQFIISYGSAGVMEGAAHNRHGQGARNARAIAATPDLLAECIALREREAKLRAVLRTCERALLPIEQSDRGARNPATFALKAIRAALTDKGAE